MNALLASSGIGSYLKKLGNRKQRHTFNKVYEPGLVHVIQFQMGAYQVGQPAEAPPYRYNLYGQFTVNLSVFIAEVYEITADKPAPDNKMFIPEVRCQVRNRLGALLPEKGDRWWSLDADVDELSEGIHLLLDAYGIPHLAKYTSREATMSQLAAQRGEAMDYGLFLAIMLWKQGDHEQAETILAEECRKYDIERPNFANYIRKLAGRMNLYVTMES